MTVSRPRIGAIAILVRDYDEAKAWFTTKLGFTVVDDRPMEDGKRWVVVGQPGAETRLLDAITRLDGASAEKLATQTGGSMTTVRAGLARLSALGYVDAGGSNGKTYRAVARASGV